MLKFKYIDSYLQLKHQLHAVFAKRVDVIQDECNYNVNPIRLMGGYASLEEKRGTEKEGKSRGREKRK